MLKKTLMTGAVVAALVAPSFAFADDTPPYSVTTNVGLFSQYLFRGVEQTFGAPALQGGADLTTAAGFYLGTWGSNISWLQDAGAYNAGGGLEWDLYGGYRGSIGASGLGYDVGLIQYQYIGKHAGAPTANTTEFHAGVSYSVLSFTVYYNLFNYFGVADSDGTIYYNLAAAIPLASTGLTANLHAGHTAVAGTGHGSLNYNDFSAGVSYALGSYTFGGMYSYAKGKDGSLGVFTLPGDDGNRQQGLSQWVVSVSRSF